MMSGDDFSKREARARSLFRGLSEHERTRETEGVAPALPELPRYSIQGTLGEGASAVVYRALDRELNRAVALKVLRGPVGASEIRRQRFRREAQAAAGLSHPNLVTVHDVGPDPERPYIVLELVEGRPLSDVLAKENLEERELVRILAKAADGVEAAHRKGIVHRDLKPANILVTASNEPKVGDFGLAHLLDSESALTRTGSALGTPLYMSPEQVEGRPSEISPRTDVYALGAILYEMLAGKAPFTGETAMDVYRRISREEPVPPRRIRHEASADLQTVALKALQKRPSDRYASAAEFAEDLRRHLEGEPVRARPVPRWIVLWRGVARRRAAVGAALLAAAVVAILLLFVRAGDRPVGRIEQARGRVTVLAGDDQRPGAAGDPLLAGHGLSTDESGEAVIAYPDGSTLRLGPGTWVRELEEKRLFMVRGRLRGSGSSLVVATPTAEVQAGKSTFHLIVDSTRSLVDVDEGDVSFLRMRDGKRITVAGGRYAVTSPAGELVAVPAKEGLVGFWSLDEKDGAAVTDSSGSELYGTVTGDASRVEARQGRGLLFRRAGGLLKVPAVEARRFPPSGALSFWLKGDFRDQRFMRVFDQYSDGSRNAITIATDAGIPGLVVQFQVPGPGDAWRGTLVLSADRWHHVAVVWDGEKKAGAVYLDGALRHSGPYAIPAWTPSEQRFIFGSTATNYSFEGELDEIALFGKPLTPEAVWRLSQELR